MTFSDAIQLGAVLAAVGAAIVALVISALDRRNARTIAADDRASALRQAHLMFELEALSRLSENFNRGGSTDAAESKQMGAEALTLIGLLSPQRLPNLWAERVGSDEKLEAHLHDPEFPEYKKWSLETQLAVSAVLRDIRAETSRE